MTRRRRALVAVLLTVAAGDAATANESSHDVGKALAACHGMSDGAERLKCYDAIALQLSPPKFSGRLTATTERFTITAPQILRYESDGPIFVMYLKNDEGEVLQNLHIGGGGQERFVIEKPGTYFLSISGSETWRIWLDPQ